MIPVYLQKESRILAREEAKKLQKKRIERNGIHLKSMLYTDIMRRNSRDMSIPDRLKKRTESLVKHGYLTSDFELTELGKNKVIEHAVSLVKLNLKQKKDGRN